MPWALETDAVMLSASQLVGLNVNAVPVPPTVTLIVLTLSGTPSIICGNGSDTTLTCAVAGSI